MVKILIQTHEDTKNQGEIIITPVRRADLQTAPGYNINKY